MVWTDCAQTPGYPAHPERPHNRPAGRHCAAQFVNVIPHSEEFKTTPPEIPWRRVVGLRNRIIHEYFGVDLEIVWSVITDDLPPLRSEIKRIIDGLK
jgi:hypothetical protein